jgi:hypothetical protein
VDGFQRLAVYRRAVALSDDLRRSVEAWPSFDLWTVGVQREQQSEISGARTKRWPEPERTGGY